MSAKTRRLGLIVTLATLALAGSAQARQVHQYHYNGEFFEAGGSSPLAIAVDSVNEKVLVVGAGDKEHGLKISRFNLDGTPAGFPGQGEATSFNTGVKLNFNRENAAIAVDESEGSSAGNFYIADGEKVYGYTPDGKALSGFPSTAPGLCGVAVDPAGFPWVANQQLGLYAQYGLNGTPTGRSFSVNTTEAGCRIAIDQDGNFYLDRDGLGEQRIAKYDYQLHFAGLLSRAHPFGGKPRFALDRADGTLFQLFPSPTIPPTDSLVVHTDSSGDPITNFGGADPAHFSYGGLGVEARDLAVDPQTGKVYVLNRAGEVNVFEPEASATTAPSTSAGGVEDLTGTSATLTGVIDPEGVGTTDCHFEWGPPNEFGEFAGYSQSIPCEQGNAFGAPAAVSAALGGLSKGVRYHYRLSAKNENGVVEVSSDREFRAADPPLLSAIGASHVTTDSARIGLAVNANGEDTSFRIEVGPDTDYGASFPVPDARVPTTTLEAPGYETRVVVLTPQPKSQEIRGLEPETLYHYRVVAENTAGTTVGEDHVFRTFALPSIGESCPNKQARQQTGSAGLMDCRGYELVSAPNTGGYDVRSGLSPQVSALDTSPEAFGAALYSMRSGTIPGIAGHPTNRGADPYLATRGADGWSTRYLGLASDNPFAGAPFASPLSGFDEALDAFAFGGSEICSPCFADGSTDVPLRQGTTEISKGMAGSLDPGPANPSGIVKAPLSPDGSHLVFETPSQFEPDANSNGTDATIYSRNLKTDTTEVISTDATGATIQAGGKLAELDVSKDGSRTLFGKEISTDSKGNPYYHLYLHIAATKASVDLMPGATEGALFAGMSEDGSRVFFTTKEQLLPADADESADAYEDEVQGPGATTPEILSLGSEGSGNTDACSPPGEPDSWNVPAGKGKCDVLAFAGGAGVASQAGDFYFLSPELLDGPSNGTQDQANLYLVEAGSTNPHFVATIDSSVGKAPPAPPKRPLITSTFGGTHSSPEGIAVDQSNGDVYLAEASQGRISRYDSAGNPKNFSEGPGEGTNQIGGLSFVEASARVAVDNSGGPFDGDVYVTNYGSVRIFSPSGAALGELSGFSEACGIAVDQSNGDVYVGDYGRVKRFSPTAAALPISNADYTATGISGPEVCDVAADDGNVYAASWPGGPARQYSASQFEAGFPFVSGALLDGSANALSTDPQTHEVYVDEGARIAAFNAAGEQQSTLGEGELSNSRGVAVNATSHHTYASQGGGAVTEFGFKSTPYVPIDNPAILHATDQAGSYDSSDFELTPDGRYAAFASLMALDGYESAAHYEVFRYAPESGEGPRCVSCSFTLSTPESDATLTSHGSSLTDDGRLFFTTAEQLTLRDTNEKRDAYEWEDGKQELVSSGTAPSDSELLSVSADGKDAFFFTRQKLVPEDENGNNVRLYDAREGGGFEFGPPTFQCAASDECHGPSTKAPPSLGAATTAGTPGQFAKEAKSGCAKPKVKRRGRCVKPKTHKHAHRHHAHKRAAKHGRGGAK